MKALVSQNATVEQLGACMLENEAPHLVRGQYAGQNAVDLGK